MKKTKNNKVRYTVGTVRGLKAILDKLPQDAKVYTTYDGQVSVYQGKKEIADINLNGY